MVRKLALTLAWLAGLTPGWVFALGLGAMNLHSYLNQPLDADIQLIGATRADLESLKVTLASPDAFERAGVEYLPELRELRFSVQRDANGEARIKVTTRNNYREPFLNFLLEATWSQGRIVREYTALVDPPVTMPVKPGAIQGPAAPAAVKPASKPAATSRPSSAAPSARVAAAAAPGEYGPTKRSDTLWSIAGKVRPDASVTMNQTMLGLVRANPDAFFDGNVNRMKAGYVLKVPSREEMTSISAAKARAEVRRQNQVWRTGATAKMAPTSKAAGGSTTSAAEPKGKLELLAPSASGKATAEGAGAAGGKPGAGAAAGGLAQQLAAAKETAEAQSQQNADLKSRISELEQQVQDMKRLSQLKDDKLAALQQQLAALKSGSQQPAAGQPAPPEQPATGEKPTAPPQPAAAAGTSQSAATTGQPAAKAPPQGAAKQPPVEARPAPPDYPINNYAVSGYKPVNPATLPKTEPKQPFKSFAQPQAPKAPPAPASYLDQALAMAQANPMLAGGAGVVVLLLLLLLLVARQRRRAAAGFEESILQEPEPTPELAAAAGAAEAGAEAAPGEQPEEQPSQEVQAGAASSYMSDFSVSGMDSIQSEVGEADPLTEADVFLAYGRFQAAESMIREAIETDPERMDLKLKLLEVYHAARNADAFEREAQALHGQVEDHGGPVWAKVVEMGSDLCPDSPLFKEETAAPAAEEGGEAAAEAPAEELGEEGFDLELEDELETAAEQHSDDNLIDFDLGEIAEEPVAEAAETGSAEESIPGEEFDLDFDLGEEGEKPSSAEGPADIDTDTFASELADELSELAEPMAPEGAEQQPSNEMEFDTVAPAGEGSEQQASEASEGGLLADVDEVGTKLDLAKAYIDMGDPEGARSILDEVLEEGSEAQRGEAHELMRQIS
ncbi:MAG: FimV/HubP family polar landmark protein [Gammaproteobacteria bacterium]